MKNETRVKQTQRVKHLARKYANGRGQQKVQKQIECRSKWPSFGVERRRHRQRCSHYKLTVQGVLQR